jgi:hypothetical protein
MPMAPVRRMIRMKEPRVLNVGQPFSKAHIAPGAPTEHAAAIARSEGLMYRITLVKCLQDAVSMLSGGHLIEKQAYGSLSMS